MTGYETRQKPVHFEFTHPTAVTVRIAGTFNDWRPPSQTHASHVEWSLAEGNGLAVRHLRIFPGAVDGRWLSDPLVKEAMANPIGGGTPFLRRPAHLKHFTPPVRDFYNQPTKTNKKTRII